VGYELNIIVHAVCFNEAPLLPFFLNYYGQFASKIVIYDNLSTDNSREIALSYPNVQVIPFGTNGLLSELTLMEIRNNCWKQDNSDFSIICDIDEFLYAPDLLGLIQRNHNFCVFKPVGYDMVSDKFPADYSRPITEQVRNGRLVLSHSKTVLLKPNMVSEMNFGPGSHTSDPEYKSGVNVSNAMYIAKDHADDLKLLHFKNLGLDYRYARHRALASRLGGGEYEHFRFGYHYNFDFIDQEREFRDLEANAFQVIQ